MHLIFLQKQAELIQSQFKERGVPGICGLAVHLQSGPDVWVKNKRLFRIHHPAVFWKDKNPPQHISPGDSRYVCEARSSICCIHFFQNVRWKRPRAPQKIASATSAARCLLMDESVLPASVLLRIADGAPFVVSPGAAAVTDQHAPAGGFIADAAWLRSCAPLSP